jgi:hypothetical protein
MVWKIAFWLLCLFYAVVAASLIFAAQHIDFGLTTIDLFTGAIIWLLEGVVMVGMFGLAYHRKYLSAKFWKTIFFLYAFAIAAPMIIDLAFFDGSFRELSQVPPFVWIAGTLFSVAQFVALYVYAWRTVANVPSTAI